MELCHRCAVLEITKKLLIRATFRIDEQGKVLHFEFHLDYLKAERFFFVGLKMCSKNAYIYIHVIHYYRFIFFFIFSSFACV